MTTKAKQLVDSIILNNKRALIALLRTWGYEPRVNYRVGGAEIDTLELIYDLAWLASSAPADTATSVACAMCDKWQPARKAITSVDDIPACEQCAEEYLAAQEAGTA